MLTIRVRGAACPAYPRASAAGLGLDAGEDGATLQSREQGVMAVSRHQPAPFQMTAALG